MKNCVFFFFLYVSVFSYSQETSSEINRKAVLCTIPKTSIRKLFLFATLYQNTEEGNKALQQAFDALALKNSNGSISLPLLFTNNITSLSALSDPSLFLESTYQRIPEETLLCIEELGKNLATRKLKGHTIKSLKEIENLEINEIDLSQALLLLENKLSPNKELYQRSTQAALDLLALSIIAKIGNDASPSAKIHALNHLLFDELAVRFPPLSEVEGKVQEFSELSTVLFSRRGICLGASTLYLCLAQRIDLPLSIFTPPGHIFVGYQKEDTLRTIETTARGIEIPIDDYLGINLRSLAPRSIKEVIGMVSFNRASNAIKEKNWEKALELYHLALLFESDEELSQMISLTELILERKKDSLFHAQNALKNPSPQRLEHDLMLLDLSKGYLSPTSAKTILETLDIEPEKLPEYIQKLEDCIQKDRASLSLPLHLAGCWFAYRKPKEALPLLERIALSKDAPCSVHFILAELYESRLNYKAAWSEAKKAVILAKQQGTIPKPLRKFILSLHATSPNCEDLADLLL